MRPAGAQMLEVSQILTSPVEAVYLPVQPVKINVQRY